MQSAKMQTTGLVTAPAAKTASANRMAYIDNLRVFLTILVIVLHSAVTYGSEGGWYYKEPTDDLAVIIPLTIISAILQSFFMGLFFFLGGYFTPGSVDRKGSARFILDRVLRLGVPCLVFYYAINPLTNYIVDGLILDWPLIYGPHIGTMWFAQALLILGVLYGLGRAVIRQVSTKEPASFPAAWQLAALVAVMAVLTFGVRYYYPRGTGMFGMIFGDFPQYLIMFIAGIAAFRNKWLDAIDGVKARPLAAALGVLFILLPVMMVLGEDPVYGFEPFMGGLYWQAAAYATWESCMVVVVSLLLLQAFQKRFTTQNRVQSAMASAAYTVYIIHPVILVLLSYLLLGVNVHPLVKFALIVPMGTVITFTAAHLIKQIPGTGKVL